GPAGRAWHLAGHRSRPVGAEPATAEPVGFDGLENWQPVLLAGARRGRHDHARRAAIAGRRPITGRPVAVRHAVAGQRPVTRLRPVAVRRAGGRGRGALGAVDLALITRRHGRYRLGRWRGRQLAPVQGEAGIGVRLRGVRLVRPEPGHARGRHGLRGGRTAVRLVARRPGRGVRGRGPRRRRGGPGGPPAPGVRPERVGGEGSGGMGSGGGSHTGGVSPPSEAGRSGPRMPCRPASRATTNRPIRRDTATSTTGGLSSRELACAISSASIPTPWSVMSSSTPPLFSKCPDTPTAVSAPEKLVAFSTSPERKCTTSLTPCPRTPIPRCTVSVTR